MKLLLLLAFALMPSLTAIDNDVIILLNGDEINCKVIRITDATINYEITNEIGEIEKRSVATKDVFMVRYADGAKKTFLKENNQAIPVSESPPKLSDEQLTSQAIMDARTFYRVSTLTIISSYLAGFFWAYILPPISLFLLGPDPKRFMFSKAEYAQSAVYMQAYKKEAKRIRRRAVWKGLLTGFSLAVLVLFILIVGWLI